jgi:hypothetical protein
MCQVIKRINKIEELLLESIEHEKELKNRLNKYHDIMIGIDHELQIKKLTAPRLAKVMRYRQQLLLERRDVKDEWLRVHSFNQNANATKLLQVTKCAAGVVNKTLERQEADGFIEDRGMIDHILSLEDVSQIQIVS